MSYCWMKCVCERQYHRSPKPKGLTEDAGLLYRTTHSCVTYVTRHEPFWLATCFEERCHSTISFGSGGGFRWATPAQPGVGRQPQAPI